MVCVSLPLTHVERPQGLCSLSGLRLTDLPPTANLNQVQLRPDHNHRGGLGAGELPANVQTAKIMLTQINNVSKSNTEMSGSEPSLRDPAVHHGPAGSGQQREGHHHPDAVTVVGLAQEPKTDIGTL